MSLDSLLLQSILSKVLILQWGRVQNKNVGDLSFQIHCNTLFLGRTWSGHLLMIKDGGTKSIQSNIFPLVSMAEAMDPIPLTSKSCRFLLNPELQLAQLTSQTTSMKFNLIVET